VSFLQGSFQGRGRLHPLERFAYRYLSLGFLRFPATAGNLGGKQVSWNISRPYQETPFQVLLGPFEIESGLSLFRSLEVKVSPPVGPEQRKAQSQKEHNTDNQ
jgi:hypothetical protein